MLLLTTLLFLVPLYQVHGCQPELEDEAASLVGVQYDRQGDAAIYVDKLSVEMKNKKKFSYLLKPGCNGRRDVQLEIKIRKEGTEEWEEKASKIRISLKSYDKIDIDPCGKYEVKLLVKSLKGKETRELPIFTVGPFHKLDPEEVAISRMKGDVESFIETNFQYEYQDITDTSVTIKWEPICALIINVMVKGQDQEWEEVQMKKIQNDIDNPTTEITFDVDPCTIIEVSFDFYIDSAEQFPAEKELKTLTTNPNKEILSSMFSEHSYDNITNVISWDYSPFIDQLDCIEKFKYKLIKNQNGGIETAFEGTDKDKTKNEFLMMSMEEECNFSVRMEVEYITVEGHKESIEAFEIRKGNQKDNDISIDDSSISYAVNSCTGTDSNIAIGLMDVGNAEIVGEVIVDKSLTSIERSAFDEMGLKSCVVYKISLLRKEGDKKFQELDSAEYENPKWNSWKAPNIHENKKHKTSNSVVFEIADLETDGECAISKYQVKCEAIGTEDVKDNSFQHDEKLNIEDLLPETSYNCSGKIVHNIPEFGDFETPWSDHVTIDTILPDTQGADYEPEPEAENAAQKMESNQSSDGTVTSVTVVFLILSAMETLRALV